MGIRDWLESKLFRGQRVIYMEAAGSLVPGEIEVLQAYNKIAVATRCVNLITDYATPIELNVYNKEQQYFHKIDNASKVETFLDFPNPFQDKYSFWNQHYMYLLLYGINIIVLENDGFYNLLPTLVEIIPDQVGFIKEIRFGSSVVYKPDEVAIIKLNSSKSPYMGEGVLEKLSTEINLVNKMLTYQESILKSGGVHKYAFQTDNLLSEKIKDKIRDEWKKFYSFSSATAGQPPILEGGLKLEKINITMQDLDFNQSVERLEQAIAISLGVTPALLDGGNNNANMNVLLRLFHLSTVLPLVDRTCSSLTRLVNKNAAWFKIAQGKTVHIRPDIGSIIALREDADKVAAATQGLYSVGGITKNELRVRNGFPQDPDTSADEYLTPQNIAGSAINPQEGGRPPKKGDKK